ncbi:MAG: GNAT family N-acetyltransferase [Tannerellaceae bacterium]|nr:GNAT family N-acetyltransferase [Tannerellaceae bacterium]
MELIHTNGNDPHFSNGFTSVVLETGINQPEAIRLYEKNGYIRIANYGPYINQPDSVCMKKIL